MAWVRLDDQFHDHPKVVDAGPLAEALFFRGLTYAARYLTDGFVPAGVLRRMGDMDAVAEAGRLVACGLWETTEGGWLIHDYLDYQPSKERVVEDRAKNARRQDEWRSRQRAVTADAPSNEYAERNAVTNDGVTGVSQVPRTHTRPVPVPDEETATAVAGAGAPAREATAAPTVLAVPKTRTARSRIAADWRPTPERMAWARDELHLPPEFVEAQVEQFRDHWLAKGEPMADWDAAWRKWLRNAMEYAGRGGARASPNGRGGARGMTAAETAAWARELEAMGS